jgi:F-type H+-transporting ATPase subunit b
MRASPLRALTVASSLVLTATPALAQHEEAKGGLLTPSGGLMVWTLLVFVLLWVILTRFAFKPLTAAVEARERTLTEAIENARRDREEAARLLEEQQRQIEAARTEAQRVIVEGRATGERLRNEMLEQTRLQQQELLERARRDIEAEKERAIVDLRREAVDLAIAGAGRVIERNLDDQANRKLVEGFLASIDTAPAKR